MKKSEILLTLLVVSFSPSSFAQPFSIQNLSTNGTPFLPPSLRNLQEHRTRITALPSYSRSGAFKATGSVDTAWVRYFRNQMVVPARDIATKIVADPKGNVYVTGITQGSSLSSDFTTIKYTPAGDTAWVKRFLSGSGPLLTVDKSGNAYLAGTAVGVDTQNPDYVTIKYDPAGDTVWIRRYNGPANSSDYAEALAVDDCGNIYVTGTSAGDYVTIKYNPAGDSLWVRSYNGPASGSDEPSAIALDDNGNVYVTGGSYGYFVNTAIDYPLECATIKYSPSGNMVWASRYQMPGKERSWPIALAVDKNGNVCVGLTSYNHFDGYDSGFDYGIIKYNSRGDTVWTRSYSGPVDHQWDFLSSLAIDSSGNVYVTGNSEDADYENSFMATIKYNSSGDSVWTRTYNGPGSQRDYAHSLAIDEQGNVFVVGGGFDSSTNFDYTTIKYDPAGNVTWVRRYNSPGNGLDAPASVALDRFANVFVTGTTGPGTESRGRYFSTSFATVKYTGGGDSLWSRTFNQPRFLSAENRAAAFDIDGSGNAYVTGTASYVINVSAAVTVKYNSLGDTVWTRSPMGANQQVFRVDLAGNVYVADGDFLILKYNPSGDSVWTADYSPYQARLTSLVFDESDNVYAAGSLERSYNVRDCATIKYNPTGVYAWRKRYKATTKSWDEARSLAVDQSGNVYVTGYSWLGDPSPPLSADFLTIKYDSHGDTIWARRYNDSQDSRAVANLIALDAEGNTCVAGSVIMDLTYAGSWTKSHYAAIKYDPAGDTLWARIYTGVDNRINIPTSLAVDNAGNVFVTGYSQNADGSYDCATIKYSPAGNTVWVKRSPQNGASPAFVAVDAEGNAYVTCSCAGADSSTLTTKYSPSGAEEWAARYTHLANAVGMLLDKEGNVYIAGTGLTSDGPVYAVVKYAQGLTSVKSEIHPVPVSSALEQNYPNPFNPVTTIKYSVGRTGDEGRGAGEAGAGKAGAGGLGLGTRKTMLAVYDVLGRQVAVLVDAEKAPGSYEVSFDASRLASGIYFYRLQAGSFAETKKLIVLK